MNLHELSFISQIRPDSDRTVYVSSWTPKLRETDRVLGQLWQIDSTSLHEMWHTIDQWSINEGRDELYNDQIHFNGPLSKATLQQVLNEVFSCCCSHLPMIN